MDRANGGLFTQFTVYTRHQHFRYRHAKTQRNIY